MKAEDVLAVVVSYDGLGKTKQSVEALRGQVGYILIVDNGSDVESLAVLDSLEREAGVSVTRLGVNCGIGYALNLGVQRAREMGYAWLLTMDQDSMVDPSMVSAYRAEIERNPGRVSLAPNAVVNGRARPVKSGVVGYAITSGNLVRVSVFEEIGLYDEGLFIDCVDFDFCLRLRQAGHSVWRVGNALMQHQLGDERAVPGFLKKFYALHSPLRRYYMHRNFMYLGERYLFRFPVFVLKLAMVTIVEMLLVGFYDPRPMESYRAAIRGVRDYFARRNGIYVERTR